MSDVKRLLEQATPLPWSRSGPGPEPDGDQVWLVGNGNQAQFVAWTDASLSAMADFDLAAYAVNHLPDYEAAVEALAQCVIVFADGLGAHKDGPFCNLTDEGHATIESARAALARLRESVSA